MHNNVSKTKMVKPFLKWIRSKRLLINSLEYYYPDDLKNSKIKYYYEPFLGGGSVFFNTIQKYNIKHAYLYDINDDLIITYKVIQSDVFKLIEFLTLFKNVYIKSNQIDRKYFFEQIKNDFNYNKNYIDYNSYSNEWISRAAQFIFLNQLSKYGLYKTDKNGTYYGTNVLYKNPIIFKISNLLKINNLLKNVTLFNTDYSNFINDIKPNSFIYLDPPVLTNDKRSYDYNFYPKYQFNSNKHIELYNIIKLLKKNHKFMLTTINSNDNFFTNTYINYNITNIKHHKYNQTNNELIITNY